MIIFDLDGTLADISHRRHLVEDKKNKNFPLFYAMCKDDKPNAPVIRILHALQYLEIFPDIQIWSGRSDEVRSETVDWLAEHVFQSKHVANNALARMRKAGDYTPDHILKENWLKEELANGTRIDMVFDDRNRVVQMWRSYGITCLQVADGNF